MLDPQRLTAELIERYGELVSQRELARLLGYRSVAALRKAGERGHLPVPTFRVPGRRGRFGFTRDVSAWLFKLRFDEHAKEAIPETATPGEEGAM